MVYPPDSPVSDPRQPRHSWICRLAAARGSVAVEYVGLAAVIGSILATAASAVDANFGARLVEAVMQWVESSLGG